MRSRPATRGGSIDGRTDPHRRIDRDCNRPAPAAQGIRAPESRLIPAADPTMIRTPRARVTVRVRRSAPPRPRGARSVRSAARTQSRTSSSADHPVKIHEYQAKQILARYGVAVPRGEVAFNPAEAGEIAKRLGGGTVVVKAQIHAGRPRQGRRSQARQVAGRSRAARERHHRDDPGHAPDGARGARGHARAGRGRAPDDEGAVPRHRHRPVGRLPGDDGQFRRRNGDREGRRGDAAPDQEGLHRPGRRPAGVPGPAARVRDRRRSGARAQGRQDDDGHLRDVREDRRVPGRDQPAGDDGRAARCWRSTRR